MSACTNTWYSLNNIFVYKRNLKKFTNITFRTKQKNQKITLKNGFEMPK